MRYTTLAFILGRLLIPSQTSEGTNQFLLPGCSWPRKKTPEPHSSVHIILCTAKTGQNQPKAQPDTYQEEKITELKRRPLSGFLLCLDTIVKYWNGKKRFILTAIDRHTKVAFARMYTAHSSASARDFLYRLHLLLDGRIENVQTDNGSEFHRHFEAACQDLDLEHYWSRVKTPKDNAVNERFNRTLQDEFIALGNMTADPVEFNRRLTEWLIEYNFRRPHQTLNYMPPISFTFKYHKVLPMYPSSTSSCTILCNLYTDLMARHNTQNLQLERLRNRFLKEVAEAAPLAKDTTYAEWQDRIRAYLDTLTPWQRWGDSACGHLPFNYVPECKLIPFHGAGYVYFRAWLRRHGLDPDRYHPDDEPCPRRLIRSAASSHPNDGVSREGRDALEFPSQLRFQREKTGLTLEQMAHLMGMKSVDRLGQYEQGVRLPTLRNALALEIIFKMPIHSLFPALASEARHDLQRRTTSSFPVTQNPHN